MRMVTIKITRDSKVTKLFDCVGVSRDGSGIVNLMSYAGVMQQVKMEDEHYETLVSSYESQASGIITVDIADGKATVSAAPAVANIVEEVASVDTGKVSSADEVKEGDTNEEVVEKEKAIYEGDQSEDIQVNDE